MKYTVKKKEKQQDFIRTTRPSATGWKYSRPSQILRQPCSAEQYEKRVSWLSGGSSIAIYEYKGVCPPLKPHSHIRMHPKVMQNVKSDTKFKKAGDIYLSGNSFEGPTNKKQIYNAKARAKHQGQEHVHKANFDDEVAAVEELQHTMPFVRLIIRLSQKSPCIILYTEDQLNDETLLAVRSVQSLAFPKSPRLACAQHLKKNLKHALADKVGMPQQQRQKLIQQIFAPSVIVATSNSHVEVEDRFLSLIDTIDNVQIKLLLERLSPLDRPDLCIDSALWTNSNYESINHVLKQTCS
ncbi:hypothetical protein PoB_001741900 [Plakobranchus ocellatus]|uniref:MULE transposase domain-containing protein n=1 Tax=Plakobranchus ocellatus TaxID=259542 RepID=A0AAV3Z6F9_9GAST|nr:hypothetical protein PoB_001741900 [Plakobranchus ocellatus]